MRSTPKLLTLVCSAFLLALSLAPSAQGRDLFAVNYESDDVAVVDIATNALSGSPISLPGAGPFTLAITPDGTRAFTANYETSSVSVIDTRTRAVVGGPIPVGVEPVGIGITPDGTRAYVASGGPGTVSVIDTATNQLAGPPIPAGPDPSAIAITPDGSRVFVSNTEGASVSVIDTATNQPVGAPIPVGAVPYGIAATPDGSRVLVASRGTESIYVIDASTLQVIGAPIPVDDANAVAITPNGSQALVSGYIADKVSVIDLQTNQEVGTIPNLDEAEYMAVTPDGSAAYVSLYGTGSVARIDLGTRAASPPLKLGEGTGQVAIIPNQPPIASFISGNRARPGVPVALDASATVDPDGTPGAFAWSFGDGRSALLGTPVGSHAFTRPGNYRVTLTVTDNEGCSTAFVFTGQTASCNGSPIATQTRTVAVAFPGLRVRCPKSARRAGCRFTVQAVSRRPTKKRPKVKAKSAVSRVRSKAGGKAIVSIKPKRKFRKRLAGARKILVRETRRIGGKVRIRTVRLRVVR